jgi:hypothetical protein
VNDKLPPSLERFAAELEQAIRRERAPRRDRRFGRFVRARPRLLAGTTVGAAGAGAVLALVLSAAGSSPAFAVTGNRDGSYTVTLRSLTAIPAANRKLSQMGVHAWIAKVGADCNNALLPQGHTWAQINAPATRGARTTVIAAWRNGNQVKVASSMTKAAASACAPPCPAGNGVANSPSKAASAVVPDAFHNRPGSGSGNSGNSVSVYSGNGGSASKAQTIVFLCPGAPTPGGGDTGNSDNSGSGS